MIWFSWIEPVVSGALLGYLVNRSVQNELHFLTERQIRQRPPFLRREGEVFRGVELDALPLRILEFLRLRIHPLLVVLVKILPGDELALLRVLRQAGLSVVGRRRRAWQRGDAQRAAGLDCAARGCGGRR